MLALALGCGDRAPLQASSDALGGAVMVSEVHRIADGAALVLVRRKLPASCSELCELGVERRGRSWRACFVRLLGVS